LSQLEITDGLEREPNNPKREPCEVEGRQVARLVTSGGE
jgi:hypothetical protein